MKKYESVEERFGIEEVKEHDDCYEIRTDRSWVFMLYKKWVQPDTVPCAGDDVTIYTYQGASVRGITCHKSVMGMDLNIVYFYKSDEELEAHRQEWLANYAKEKAERFDREKDKLDRDFASLPEILQKRIQRFRDEDPNFRVDSESYEMFCCTEAVKIADHCKTADAVKAFKEAPWEEQKAVVDDGHSGNTFGGACALAWRLVQGLEC